MPPSRAAAVARLAASLAVGGALAWIAAGRIGEIPSVPEVVAVPEGPGAWALRVVARGDEPLGDLTIEALTRGLRLDGPTRASGLARGASFRLRAVRDTPGPDPAVVRLVEVGGAGRIMDIVLREGGT